MPLRVLVEMERVLKQKPNGIINTLGLRDVDYNRTAALGHFWDQLMPWEN